MDAHTLSRDDASMTLDLSDAELATAATACRAMAYQEGERAKKMENPTMRQPIEKTAKRFAALPQEARTGAPTLRQVSSCTLA
jgi:hypothetical protein